MRTQSLWCDSFDEKAVCENLQFSPEVSCNAHNCLAARHYEPQSRSVGQTCGGCFFSRLGGEAAPKEWESEAGGPSPGRWPWGNPLPQFWSQRPTRRRSLHTHALFARAMVIGTSQDPGGATRQAFSWAGPDPAHVTPSNAGRPRAGRAEGGRRGGPRAPCGGNCAHVPPVLDPPPPNGKVNREQCTRGKYGRDEPETTV